MTPEKKPLAAGLRIFCLMPFICVGIGIGWALQNPGWGLAATGLMVWVDVLFMKKGEPE